MSGRVSRRAAVLGLASAASTLACGHREDVVVKTAARIATAPTPPSPPDDCSERGR